MSASCGMWQQAIGTAGAFHIMTELCWFQLYDMWRSLASVGSVNLSAQEINDMKDQVVFML